MIPKIIHQTWKSEALPIEMREFQQSWRDLHPDWEYRLWTDEDCLRLVREEYPWLLDVYQAYPFNVQRADMARVLFVHSQGGLYVDIDFECLNRFEPLLSDHKVVLGMELVGLGPEKGGREQVCNALIASETGHPFWEHVLKEMHDGFRLKRPWEGRGKYVLSTGLLILDRESQEYAKTHDDLKIYSNEYFYATSVMHREVEMRRRISRAKGAYAIHHYADSWVSPLEAMMIHAYYRFARAFGLLRH